MRFRLTSGMIWWAVAKRGEVKASTQINNRQGQSTKMTEMHQPVVSMTWLGQIVFATSMAQSRYDRFSIEGVYSPTGTDSTRRDIKTGLWFSWRNKKWSFSGLVQVTVSVTIHKRKLIGNMVHPVANFTMVWQSASRIIRNLFFFTDCKYHAFDVDSASVVTTDDIVFLLDWKRYLSYRNGAFFCSFISKGFLPYNHHRHSGVGRTSLTSIVRTKLHVTIERQEVELRCKETKKNMIKISLVGCDFTNQKNSFF